MKLLFKTLLYSFVTVITTVGFGSTEKIHAKDAYAIKIKVKGLAKDTVCYLAYYYGDKQYLKDTAVVDANGTFTFEGKDVLPNGIYMAVLPGKKYFEFIVKEQSFSLETDTNDYVANMKTKGTGENQLFYQYLKFIGERGKKVDSLRKEMEKVKDNKELAESFKTKISAIDKEVKDYKSNVIKNNPNTFVSMLFKATEEPEVPKNENKSDSLFAYRYYKAHYFDNIDFSSDDILRTPIYHEKIKSYLENLTFRHPDSINKSADILVEKTRKNKELFKYTVWWITNSHESANWMGADAIFVHMVDKYYTKDQAFWLDSARLAKVRDRAKILKPLLIGKKAPNLMLQDTLGKTIPMYNVKAKYLVVVFWDPECGHCQKEVPKVYAFYNDYKSKGVEVYAVNATHDEKRVVSWKKFIRDNKLHWINVHDTGPYYDFTKTYDIYSYPVIYLLDENKEILAKRIAAEQLSEVVDNMSKSKSKPN
jgi:thiol-disulfide isomerase/thioredoxin